MPRLAVLRDDLAALLLSRLRRSTHRCAGLAAARTARKRDVARVDRRPSSRADHQRAIGADQQQDRRRPAIGGITPLDRRSARASRSSMNRNLPRPGPATRSRAPTSPVTTASMRNGSWVYQRVAPTSRMTPTSIAPGERRHLDGVGDQQQRGERLHEREREGHVAHAAEEVEELRDDVPLVDHLRTPTWPFIASRTAAAPSAVRVLQLHPQRRRQRLRPHDARPATGPRTAACTARRPAAGSRSAPSRPAASSPASSCSARQIGLAAVGVVGRDVRGERDLDLDPVAVELLGAVDRAHGEQPGADQRERDRGGQDHRDRSS